VTGPPLAKSSVGEVLKTLFRGALRGDPDIVSLALGDRHGLPVVDAVRGNASAMALTAAAAMSLQSGMSAATTVGLKPAIRIHIHAEDGELILYALGKSGYALIAQMRPGANLGLAWMVLERLGGQLLRILSDEFGADFAAEPHARLESAGPAGAELQTP